jgi:hypothetical protein
MVIVTPVPIRAYPFGATLLTGRLILQGASPLNPGDVGTTHRFMAV